MRREVLNEAKTLKGLYICRLCGHSRKRDKIAIDHIEPVVGMEGFTTWDHYIQRLFCGSDNLQVVCKACHKAKTKQEGVIRRANKRAR